MAWMEARIIQSGKGTPATKLPPRSDSLVSPLSFSPEKAVLRVTQ